MKIVEPYRGTGRTHRMLEGAIADESDHVVVVAHTYDFAFHLCRRTAEMMGDDVAKRSRNTITRRDGREIRFERADRVSGPRFRGLEASVHWDHAAR